MKCLSPIGAMLASIVTILPKSGIPQASHIESTVASFCATKIGILGVEAPETIGLNRMQEIFSLS